MKTLTIFFKRPLITALIASNSMEVLRFTHLLSNKNAIVILLEETLLISIHIKNLRSNILGDVIY